MLSDETHCLNCDRRLSDLQVWCRDEFCSEECQSDWHAAVRANIEASVLEWGMSGPPDTAALDSPPWHYR